MGIGSRDLLASGMALLKEEDEDKLTNGVDVASGRDVGANDPATLRTALLTFNTLSIRDVIVGGFEFRSCLSFLTQFQVGWSGRGFRVRART